MFEHITINRQGMTGVPIDLGALAECLVFYEKVRVIADVDSFKYLVRCCGTDELLHLFDMGVLEIEFFENLTGVATVETNHGQIHELKLIEGASTKYDSFARKFFEEWAGPSGKGANRLFNHFRRHVKRSSHTLSALEDAQADFFDSSYLRESVAGVLSILAPEYVLPAPFRFSLRRVLKGASYQVDTNIDFAAANASYWRHVPKEMATISVAFLLAHILDARRDLNVGSEMQSDFLLGPTRSIAVSCKFADLLAKANKGVQVADLFQEDVTDGVPRIRETVNSGGRDFSDVIRLVEKAEKFKSWIKKHGSTSDLRREYLRETAHLDWANNLAPKSVRMLTMTGAGVALGLAAGTIAGPAGLVAGGIVSLGLNAIDYFVLDKLLKGWKPNQFIEEPLKQFLDVAQTKSDERKHLL